MSAQDILKSLSNLEQSLQGVESAKKQVDKTVAAYGAAQKQLATLSQEFVNVSNALNEVTDLVRDNQKQLSATLSAKIERLLGQMESKVNLLGNKAIEINKTFETNCLKTSQSINDNFDAALVSFKGKFQDELSEVSRALSEFNSIVKDIKVDFEKDASKTIASLEKTGDKIATQFQDRIANQLGSMSQLKDELAKTIKLQKQLNIGIMERFETESTTIINAISSLEDQLKAIKNNNDKEHKELLNVLSSIAQGNNPSAEKLTDRINTVDGNIGAVKDGVSSVSSQLGTATNQIIDSSKQTLLSEVAAVKSENAMIKKLVIFCLVAAGISAVLNIVMLLH